MNLNCCIRQAIGTPGEGLLAKYIPQGALIPDEVGPEYEPNRYCHWEMPGDGTTPDREGYVYTKHCSRKLRRTWEAMAKQGRMELIYLVEARQAIRRSNTWINYVVVSIPEDSDDRVPIRLGTKTTSWRRGSVQEALRQGGIIPTPNGIEFDSLESYDEYIEGHKRAMERRRKLASADPKQE